MSDKIPSDESSKKIDLSKSDSLKINDDGSVSVGGVVYSSMEDFAASIKEREEEIKK